MAPSNADELTYLSLTGTQWQPYYAVGYEASSSDTTNANASLRFYRFKLKAFGATSFYNPSTSTLDTDLANRHSIKFFYNTGEWVDGSTIADPTHLTAANAQGTTTSVSGYPQTLYIWNNNNLNAGFDLSQHSWASVPATWTTSSTHTPATGTQSHSYVQDSIRDITYTKTAPYQFELEFDFRDVSSAPYNSAMGQNAVTMTAKRWPGGGTTSADIVQYTYNQVDATNKMTITSATQYPNAQIDTGDVVTLTSDIDMQVLGTNGTWGWITAGSTLFTVTYEATNVVPTVGTGYVGDSVSVEFVDQNIFPDYDNEVLLTYGSSGSTSNLTSVVLGSTTKLQSSNNHTLSGSWTVGYDGVSTTGLAGTLEMYRKTPAPANATISVGQRQFALNPYGQGGTRRRRAHSFW